MATKRNYRKEYDSYHKKPAQRKNNNARHRARYSLDHKKPLSKGGSNMRKNLRLVSRTTNRKKAAK